MLHGHHPYFSFQIYSYPCRNFSISERVRKHCSQKRARIWNAVWLFFWLSLTFSDSPEKKIAKWTWAVLTISVSLFWPFLIILMKWSDYFWQILTRLKNDKMGNSDKFWHAFSVKSEEGLLQSHHTSRNYVYLNWFALFGRTNLNCLKNMAQRGIKIK